MSKQNIAIIFGGQSSEHEISCVSVLTIADAIQKEKYDITLIGITVEGNWLLADNSETIQDGSWRNSQVSVIISPDASKREMIMKHGEDITFKKVDVIFPILHGMYGEDGTIQGLFEMARIPYVGCGVLASAVSMDKLYTKIIVNTLDIYQADFVSVMANELSQMDDIIHKIEENFTYPVFVKPSQAGSSKGISKAHDKEELRAGLLEAAKHDTKILVEEMIIGRELECAILGGEEIKASVVGEILAAAEFYDYNAKYNSAQSQTVVAPKLPEGKSEEIQKTAIEIFKAVGGYGLSRVDFFLEKNTNRVVFNEINTSPGFTSISMYPMLWNETGFDLEALVEELIRLAYERA